jgi:hypothetical protein
MGSELIELALERLDLFERGIASDELAEDLADFFFVQFAFLLSGVQQVADLHFLLKFLLCAFHGFELFLDFKVFFEEAGESVIDLANFVWVEVLHEFLEVVADLEVSDQLGYLGEFFPAFLLLGVLCFDVFLERVDF